MFFLFFVGSVLACSELVDNAVFDSDVDVCNGIYFLKEGIIINGENILFDCHSAVIRGDFGINSGIRIINSNNVTVKNCNVMHYDIGINVQNSEGVFLQDNHLLKNNFGTKFFGSENNMVDSADVSLISSVKIAGSSDNIVSFFNKKIEESSFDNVFNKQIFVFDDPRWLVWSNSFIR